MSVSAIMETSGPVQLKIHFYFTNKQQRRILWLIDLYKSMHMCIYLFISWIVMNKCRFQHILNY